MRKFLMLLATSVAMLVAFAGSALAQEGDYPIAQPGPGEAVVTPGAPAPAAAPVEAGPELAITGSNTLLLLWLGIAALIIGTVLVVLARRRRAIRTRGVTAAIS
jgi:LPXTG-motif cell wall-anchored protein